MTTALRVLIADDHLPTRLAVRAALERGGFVICAEAGSGEGAVEGAVAHQPDIALLDVRMPGGGIRAAAEIRQQLPKVAIVMLTVSRRDDDLFDALRVGASGYLLKDTDPARLPHALRGVLDGEAALPRSLVTRLIDEFRGRSRRRLRLSGGRLVPLTSREWEVLDLLGEGLTTVEMAERLFVSPVTVRTHVSSILHKLRVPDRAGAVRLLRERDADDW